MGELLAIIVVALVVLAIYSWGVKFYPGVPIKKFFVGVLQGGDQDNIRFSTKDTTTSTYSSFIEALRARLTNGATSECGIPVLPQSSSVFVLVDLSNSNGKTVTVAIDVKNVYVMAFRVSDQVYVFKGAPEAEIKTSFTKTVKPRSSKDKTVEPRPLSCTCNYHDLENRKGSQSRMDTNLGITALDQAIDRLWEDVEAAVGSSLLVIIQMVSQAVRFRYIEAQVRGSIIRKNSSQPDSFKPDLFMLSLENNWSKISAAIQNRNGTPSKIELYLNVLKTKMSQCQHSVSRHF